MREYEGGNFMDIFEKYKFKELRTRFGDIEVYNPNEIKYEELNELIQAGAKMDSEMKIEQTIDEKTIRWMFRNLTSIGEDIDNLTSEQLEELCSDFGGCREFNLVYKELAIMIDEILQDFQNALYKTYVMANSVFKTIEAENMKQTIIDNMIKFMKKNGMKEANVEKAWQYLNNQNLLVEDLAKVEQDKKIKELEKAKKKQIARQKKADRLKNKSKK